MGKRLYVGNLPFQTDDAALRDAFSQEGRKVVHVNIVIDRETGRPRGFAFVEMATEEEAKAALQKMDGADFGGRRLRVNEAEDRRPPRAGGPGGPPGSGGPGRPPQGGPRPDRPAGPRPPRTDGPPGDDRAPRSWPGGGGGAGVGGGGPPSGGGGGPRPDDDRRGKSHERKGGRRRHDDEEDFGGKRGRRSSDYDDDEW